MAVFKQYNVVVTTPSSGTYVVEEIGNLGRLFDLLEERAAYLQNVCAGTPEQERTQTRTHEQTQELLAPYLAKYKTKGRGTGGTLGVKKTKTIPKPKPKRVPSKTPAAIAASKRRTRIKLEKQHAAVAELLDPEQNMYHVDSDVEEDIAEAAQAIGILKPTLGSIPTQHLGLPPDACAVNVEERDETPLPTREVDDEHEGTPPSAASVFRRRVRDTITPGTVFGFDTLEAAQCLMVGWENVVDVVVRRVTETDVHVACRTPNTGGKFVGMFRVPVSNAMRVLVDRGQTDTDMSNQPRVATPRPPPVFPSGGAERKRLASRVKNVATALTSGPSMGALSRRAFAVSNAAAANTAGNIPWSNLPEMEQGVQGGGSNKRQRPGEPFTGLVGPPPPLFAGNTTLGNTTLAQGLSNLTREVSLFRGETKASLAAIAEHVERLANALDGATTGTGAAFVLPSVSPIIPCVSPPRHGLTTPKSVPTSPDAPFKGSSFKGSSFMADARALAMFRDGQRAEAKAAESESEKNTPEKNSLEAHLNLSPEFSPTQVVPETPPGEISEDEKERALLQTPVGALGSASKSFEFDVPQRSGQLVSGAFRTVKSEPITRDGGVLTTQKPMDTTPGSPLEEGEIRA